MVIRTRLSVCHCPVVSVILGGSHQTEEVTARAELPCLQITPGCQQRETGTRDGAADTVLPWHKPTPDHTTDPTK